jgi:hypothetical protein
MSEPITSDDSFNLDTLNDTELMDFDIETLDDMPDMAEEPVTEEPTVEPEVVETPTTTEPEATEAVVTAETPQRSDEDIRAFYNNLMEPLKANGKMFELKDVDEARRLIQSGLGATKRMSDLKPKLQIMQMLEENNLMDQDRLNYLIDLDKKNPEAIKKLMMDSEIDPLTIDPDEPVEYTPGDYGVTDSSFNLQQTIETLKETPTYVDMMGKVNGFDDASKTRISNDPKILTDLNAHIADGTYEAVMSIVEREQAVGNMTHLSHLDAYEQVLNDVIAHANSQGTGENGNVNTGVREGSREQTGTQGTVSTPHNTNQNTQSRQQAAQAASNASTTGTSAVGDAALDFYSLSDEEFMKLDVDTLFAE